MSFRFKLVWRENLLGIAIDQIYGEHVVPLTNYYYWPRSDAWSQIRLELKAKNWISVTEQTFILNKTTEILNQLQASPKQNPSFDGSKMFDVEIIATL